MQSAFAAYQKQNSKNVKTSKLKGHAKKNSSGKQLSNGITKNKSHNRNKLNMTKKKSVLKSEFEEKTSWTETILNSSIEDDGLVKSAVRKHKKQKSKKKEPETPLNGSENVVVRKNKTLEPNNSFQINSISNVLQWIIAPVEPTKFFKKFWEQKPLHIQRNQELHYQSILTTEKLDKILRENNLFYGRNVDVVSYVDGIRETHNPEGRAVPAVLWDYYKNGCSIRVLNPHSYSNKLHSLLSNLQEYFGSMAGMNVYLTPPGSQGFAPHYDDIEAFVLQLEGRKHWKLYAPLTENEVLPRFSSHNLEREKLGTPIKEITLQAGDLLYFPRGVIHEGSTDADAHSLHITVSVYQKTAYVDLLEHILKPSLIKAANENIEFRQGLPLSYLKHVGMVNSNKKSELRSEIVTKVQSLLSTMMNYISIDTAADQLAKQMMWDVMPPIPTKEEEQCMIHKDGEKLINGSVCNEVNITVDIEVRLFRYYSFRVVEEKGDNESDTTVRLYYSTDNAKVYHGEEQQFLLVDKSQIPAFECLFRNYPKFVKVQALPLETDDEKILLVAHLWENGLLVTDKPMEKID